ncbi:MAG: molybdopterin-dependent oxidoreductase [Calditrichia bacterium]
MDRRDFLKFMGMASSAAVISSCGVEYSTEKILSKMYAPTDPDYLPGEPMYRNTTCTECGSGCGVSVKLVDYNPIKIEGNKAHPGSKGATCMRCQASLMRLYHPMRLKTPMLKKDGVYLQISWDEAFKLIENELTKANGAGKQSLFLSGRTSGTLSEVINSFASETGVERLPEFEPQAYNTLRRANVMLFGVDAVPDYKIKDADFLLTVGADLLETFVNPVSFSSQLVDARHDTHLKWMHAEPHASMSGFKADYKLAVKPGSEPYLLAYIIGFLTQNDLARKSLSANLANALPKVSADKAAEMTGLSDDTLKKITQGFVKARNPLVIAGGVSTAQKNGLETAVLAGVLQWITGMVNTTVDFTNSYDFSSCGSYADMDRLEKRLNSGNVGVMFIADSDPLSTYNRAEALKSGLAKAGLTVCMTDFLMQDADFIEEYAFDTPTAKAADLVLPLTNGYESFGDVSTQRGMVGFMKPVLQPLYDSHTVGDILMKIMDPASEKTYADHVQDKWKSSLGEDGFNKLMTDGFTKVSVSSISASLNEGNTASFLGSARMAPAASDGITVYACLSPRVGDGRSKVITLLTEIPDPLTTVSYGSWISISNEEYAGLGLTTDNFTKKNRDVLSVSNGVDTMNLPAMQQTGMPTGVAMIYRDQINPAMLTIDDRTGELLSQVSGIKLEKTNEVVLLAITAGEMTQNSDSFMFHGERPIVRPDHSHTHDPLHDNITGEETLYPTIVYNDYKWEMTIDQDSCVGCNACIAACYIENNVPVVGREENLNGREMSWIRFQPYYFEDGTMDSLIMMCQHCDNAPCENVCPVYATYHNPEGLNVMVYNRCVGTRYCHNNCPYKVRRFNWFDWTDRGYWQEPMSRMINPDMWVRPKGVMEKCTFCVQRIRRAKDHAKDEGRKVKDGDFTTACAQVCPTHAITFGNALDKESKVYKKSQEKERAMKVLYTNGVNMGVDPAVTYLASKEEH